MSLRICHGEKTQTLEISTATPAEAWYELGEWAADHPRDLIWQARMMYGEAQDRYFLVAYWTEG